jgi:REP element-mobilizing transposase RayT
VCPAKYRRVIFNKEVDGTLKDICLEISKRYEISFLEIRTDKNHLHFLIQSIPKYNVTEMIRMIKRIISKKIFEKHQEVKKQLWDGDFGQMDFL